MRLIGAAGVLWFWAAIVTAGALTPGYSALDMPVSMLGMVGAPYGWLIDWAGIALFGVSLVAMGLLAVGDLRPGVLAWIAGVLLILGGIGALLVGFSPCRPFVNGQPFCSAAESPINAHHALGSAMAFFLVPLAALVLGLRAFRAGPSRGFYAFTLVMALLMIAIHVLFLRNNAHPFFGHVYFGLWQRVLIGAITLWVFGLSLYLYRTESAEPPSAEPVTPD